MEYCLKIEGGADSASLGPNDETDGVPVEIVGNALKRLPRKKSMPHSGQVFFGGCRRSGRTKSAGWTRSIRKTCRELIERYRFDWRTCLHLSLPCNASGWQVESLFRRLQRWFRDRRISALGIAETPLPHFHVLICAEYSSELEAQLRAWLRRIWRTVFDEHPSPKALCWEPRDEPTEAMIKYLSKSSKGGRGVKGKARWLIFLPYFKSCLPKRERRYAMLSRHEAKKVLDPKYRLTFGAAVKLKERRKTGAKTPLLRPRPQSTEPTENPVATTTAVAAATHTSEVVTSVADNTQNSGDAIAQLRGQTPIQVYGLGRALDKRLLSLRLDRGGLEVALQLHEQGKLCLVCVPPSGCILHMLLAKDADLSPHLQIQLRPGTAVPRRFEVVYLDAR